MRLSIENFKNSSGIYYQDRYASIFEALINLFSSLILVNLIGLPGVFLGTLVSTLTTSFWVEPYIIHKYGFDKNIKKYI